MRTSNMSQIEYINIDQAEVDQLLENPSFCSLAWIHAHQAPDAKIAPCCIGKMSGEAVLVDTVDELINHDYLRNLRLDMVNGIKNSICENCYSHERDFGDSFRKGKNREFGHLMHRALNSTRTDGIIEDFEMHYYDIRFSNVCNMKCRSCGPAFSSLWENEIKIHDVPGHLSQYHSGYAPSETDLLQDVLDNHVKNIELAYFAGGEPLVSDEHYAILNKLIELEKFDVGLLYNTNASVLQFKNYNLVDMWSKFHNVVDVSASIDHVGARAEYIRHGTKWDKVNTNLKTLSNLDMVGLNVNTVVSNLNYVTLDEHVRSLVESGIIKPDNDQHIGMSPLYGPSHLCAQALPADIKAIGGARNKALIEWLLEQGFLPDNGTVTTLTDIINFTESADRWPEQREHFNNHIQYFDKIRGEDFKTTFPELASMINE